MPADEDPAAQPSPAATAAGDPAAAEPSAEERYPKPRPPAEPPKVVELRELIEAKLVELVDAYGVGDRGSYVFGFESARIFVVPAWLPDERTVVRVFAITNLDVPVTARVTSYLLAKNLDFVLGAFALDEEVGAVWFNHNLLGEYLVSDELEATLAAVAQTASELDDDIKERFGGRLYAEDPTAAVSPPHTPGYL